MQTCEGEHGPARLLLSVKLESSWAFAIGMLTQLALLLSMRGLWEQTHPNERHVHIHTHTHLRRYKTILSMINKFLDNNKNNFHVFTDGALRGLKAPTSSPHDNAASKPQIPEVEVFVHIRPSVQACCVCSPASRCPHYVHEVGFDCL